MVQLIIIVLIENRDMNMTSSQMDVWFIKLRILIYILTNLNPFENAKKAAKTHILGKKSLGS